MDNLDQWFSRFWWLRGICAALAALSLLTESLPWDKVEILRATHAILIMWGMLVSYLARITGLELVLPEHGDAIVTATFIFLTMFFPWVLSFVSEMENKADKRKNLVGGVGLSVMMSAIMFFTFAIIDNSIVAFIIVSGGLAPIVSRLVKAYPPYGRGIVTTLGFIITAEILYYLHLPIVYQAINELTCSILGDCAA